MKFTLSSKSSARRVEIQRSAPPAVVYSQTCANSPRNAWSGSSLRLSSTDKSSGMVTNAGHCVSAGASVGLAYVEHPPAGTSSPSTDEAYRSCRVGDRCARSDPHALFPTGQCLRALPSAASSPPRQRSPGWRSINRWSWAPWPQESCSSNRRPLWNRRYSAERRTTN